MATTKDQARAAILDRLTGFTRFHPANASLFADWSVEPGDVLRVENEGTIYDVPVYQMDMSWKGTPTVDVQSTGSKKRPDPSKLNKGSGYGGSRKKEEEEILMVRHQSSIDKTDERISLWATEEEWSTIAEEYQEIRRTQFDLTAEGLTSTVTGVAGGNFVKANAYAVGDVVMRNGKVYVFTSPHTANTDWNYSEVAEALNLYGSIKSHSTRITQTENAVGLVVYNGQIRAGQIMLAINGGTGHSEALIEADKVQISGNTTIGGVLSVDANGYLVVNNGLTATNADFYGTTTVETFNCNSISVDEGPITGVTSITAGSVVIPALPNNVTLDSTNAPGLHASASIANDTLTVGKLSGGSAFTIQKSGNNLLISNGTSTITFNRATLMSGTWDRGILTVLPDSSGSSSLYYYLHQGTTSWNGAYGSIPVMYSTTQSGEKMATGYTFSVNRGGSISAATPQSTQPSGNKLRTVTVGSGGNSTYIRVTSTGYRSGNDYIQINY